MKKHILALFAVITLAACSLTPTIAPIPAQSPQQVVNQACVLVPGILDILKIQEPAFPASTAAAIDNAQKVVSGAIVDGDAIPGICSPGFAVNAATVQTLANTIMPVIVNAVELSPVVTPQVKAEVAAAQGIFLLIQAQQASQPGEAVAVPTPALTAQ